MPNMERFNYTPEEDQAREEAFEVYNGEHTDLDDPDYDYDWDKEEKKDIFPTVTITPDYDN